MDQFPNLENIAIVFFFPSMCRQWSNRLTERTGTKMDRSWNSATTRITSAHWQLELHTSLLTTDLLGGGEEYEDGGLLSCDLLP